MPASPSPPDDPLDNLRADLAAMFQDLVLYRMPFGKYRGRALVDLPLEYLMWFPQRQGGFPSGRLGELMAFVAQTKADGAEAIFQPLREEIRRQAPPPRLSGKKPA